MSAQFEGMNMVSQLMNTFLGDDLFTKSAAEEGDDKDESKKGEKDKDKGDDKKPMTKDELAEYEKKEHGGKMPSKEDEEKEKKASVVKGASLDDLLKDISALPAELQKVAMAVKESEQVKAAKAAELASKQASEANSDATKQASDDAIAGEDELTQKYASGQISDEELFNTVFFEETAKLASENPLYAEILNEKFAQLQAQGLLPQPSTNAPAGV